MSSTDLNKIAHDLLSVKRMIEELEAEKEALTDKLKAEMVERGEEVLTGDCWKASWKNVTSARLDGTALKAKMPEIAKQFTKTTTTTRFTITA